MSDTTFVAGTVVTKEWLNDVNDYVYGHPITSAKSSGAIGDGIADDTVALQTGLDSLTAGGTFYVEPGTYRITADLVLSNNNVTVVGVRGASIFQQVGNFRVLYIQSNFVEVKGMKFIGDQSAGSSARANLVIIGGTGKTPTKVSIHHNDFLNSSSTCVLYGGDLATCSDIYIQSNTMTDFWENGVDCVMAGQARIYITDNIMRSSVVHPNAAVSRPIGVAMEPATAGTTTDYFVLNNLVDFSAISVPNRNVTHGCRVGQSSVVSANFTLKRAVFSNNIFRGVGKGIQINKARWGTTTESATITISDNIIESTRDTGLDLVGGEDATFGDTLIVTGNTIKGFSEATSNGYDAIFLDGYWSRPLISGNLVTARTGETGSTSGRYGVNVSSANISNARIGQNNIQNATSGNYNDASTTTIIEDVSNTSTVALTADNQEITVDNYTYISITSNDATASNRTFRLLKGKYRGQRLVLYWSGTNAGEYVDNSTASDSTVARLSATWTPTEFDSLQLVWDGSVSWFEVARSAN